MTAEQILVPTFSVIGAVALSIIGNMLTAPVQGAARRMWSFWSWSRMRRRSKRLAYYCALADVLEERPEQFQGFAFEVTTHLVGLWAQILMWLVTGATLKLTLTAKFGVAMDAMTWSSIAFIVVTLIQLIETLDHRNKLITAFRWPAGAFQDWKNRCTRDPEFPKDLERAVERLQPMGQGKKRLQVDLRDK